MITIPIEYMMILILGVAAIIWTLIDGFIIPILRYYILGQRRYLYTRIPGYGPLTTKTKWFKSEEDAIQYERQWRDFIECTYPKKYARPMGNG